MNTDLFNQPFKSSNGFDKPYLIPQEISEGYSINNDLSGTKRELYSDFLFKAIKSPIWIGQAIGFKSCTSQKTA